MSDKRQVRYYVNELTGEERFMEVGPKSTYINLYYEPISLEAALNAGLEIDEMLYLNGVDNDTFRAYVIHYGSLLKTESQKILLCNSWLRCLWKVRDREINFNEKPSGKAFVKSLELEIRKQKLEIKKKKKLR
jgi:hypothetical protein